MKLYVILLTIVVFTALVWSAPASFLDENEIELAKRAKETIMFGNQQNAPRVKKRDPEDAVGSDSVENIESESASDNDSDEDESNLDLKGNVVAMPARNTLGSDEASPSSVEEELGDAKATAEEAAEVNSAEERKGNAVEDEIDPDVKDMLDSSETNKDSESESGDEKQGDEVGLVPVPDTENPEDVDDFYKYLMRYENPQRADLYNRLPQYPPRSYYNYRRRRSLMRHMKRNGYNSNKAVKRAKRIKRDLFDDDEYYYPNLVEAPVLEEPGYGELEFYPEPEPEVDEGDLLAYLLSLYEDGNEVEEPAYEIENPYERLLEEEAREEEEAEEAAREEEEEEPVYVPVKRQMLSTLPGMRKRYFYPFNKEPQTHWGAFVPEQKRDYYNAYDRVLRLAKALADQDSYYPDIYDGYQKK
ncbi:pre-mRNA-splicing factor CWC22 homolog [Patella vulgata]|uniref:pre-mRNA-splicing factor CWC22 homolog n=1 Tax=Patella vulgata TaxID=6465 RepID=UPI0024A7AB28|nr:pre-mRNA-splicing factor CWC22 homolog [Patella vulgata]